MTLRKSSRATPETVRMRTRLTRSYRDITGPVSRGRSGRQLADPSRTEANCIVILTRFLHASRSPSSGQVRGHASLENAIMSGRAFDVVGERAIGQSFGKVQPADLVSGI